MLRAYNEANDDVYIDDSKSSEQYHCPICNNPVFRKIGNGLRRPHFAHNKTIDTNSSCDGWHYDMSDWHREWQECFPVRYREVVVSSGKEKHRADVLIEPHNVVIEFQHSHLSPEEYMERNKFYTECGYHIVWVFDMSEDIEKGNLQRQEEEGYYTWKKPWNTFRSIAVDCGDSVTNYSWNTNVHAVFMESGKILSRARYYYSEEKKLRLAADMNDAVIEWSRFTFLSFVNEIFSEKRINIPECPKCHLPMILRRFSITRDYYWGCQNYGTVSCKEREYFPGILPGEVSIDGECPYCKGMLDVSNGGVVCQSCRYEIKYAKSSS